MPSKMDDFSCATCDKHLPIIFDMPKRLKIHDFWAAPTPGFMQTPLHNPYLIWDAQNCPNLHRIFRQKFREHFVLSIIVERGHHLASRKCTTLGFGYRFLYTPNAPQILTKNFASILSSQNAHEKPTFRLDFWSTLVGWSVFTIPNPAFRSRGPFGANILA